MEFFRNKVSASAHNRSNANGWQKNQQNQSNFRLVMINGSVTINENKFVIIGLCFIE